MKKKEPSEYLHFRLPRTVRAALRKEADARHIPLATHVRAVLIDYCVPHADRLEAKVADAVA